jgi:hypothetical protein
MSKGLILRWGGFVGKMTLEFLIELQLKFSNFLMLKNIPEFSVVHK